MSERREIGPCGEACKECDKECHITQEQWDYWLGATVLSPVSKHDAMTPSRRFYYMKYCDKETGFLNPWMDRLLVKHWSEHRREDFHYRFPLEGVELRKFIKQLMRNTLSYRERYIVALHLGLEGNPPETQAHIGELYNLASAEVGIIYNKAIKKLKKALLNHPEWRGKPCPRTDQTTTDE